VSLGPGPEPEGGLAASLAALDTELAALWDQLPGLVLEAEEAVAAERAWRNTVYFLGGLMNFLGGLGANMFVISSIKFDDFPDLKEQEDGKHEGHGLPLGPGTVLGTLRKNALEFLATGRVRNDFLQGDLLYLVGTNLRMYSFNMVYWSLLEDLGLECGLAQLEAVQADFARLAVPSALHLSAGGPGAAHRRVSQWRRTVRVALHCLVSRPEGRLLADSIDMWAALARHRLDLAPGNGL
jgi:hypothetical protein